MKKIVFLILWISCFTVAAQQRADIVTIIDNLTIRWDQKAIALKDYQGIQNFCENSQDREATFDLLDQIHHWDTTLYFIVTSKFDLNKDKEAAATLKDIESLETEYTTEQFKAFIQEECLRINAIEGSFESGNVKQYEKHIKKFQKELDTYINSITNRINIIDEHVHHLKL